LLQEFKDIFLNEIQNGLSPIRGIKHQIDLVPSLTTPNRPTYRNKGVLKTSGGVNDKEVHLREHESRCCSCTFSTSEIWYLKNVC